MCVCMYVCGVQACFGGAGPQHCCAIAKSLGMKKVLVHRFSGILSAYGPHTYTYVHTYIYIHTLTHIHTITCMHVSGPLLICIRTEPLLSFILIRMHTYICIKVYIHTYTHTSGRLPVLPQGCLLLTWSSKSKSLSTAAIYNKYVRIHTYIHAHTYIFTYRCVCMCVRMCFRRVSRWPWSGWHLWNALPATSCTPP